jgi:antitoxin HicB
MLEDAFAGVLHVMLEHGDPIPEPLATREYSGRLALRLPPSLHRRVAERAALENVSLNRYLSDLIARS